MRFDRTRLAVWGHGHIAPLWNGDSMFHPDTQAHSAGVTSPKIGHSPTSNVPIWDPIRTSMAVPRERFTGCDHCPYLSQLDSKSREGAQRPAASHPLAHAGPALCKATGYNSPGLLSKTLTHSWRGTSPDGGSYLSVLPLHPLYAKERSQP